MSDGSPTSPEGNYNALLAVNAEEEAVQLKLFYEARLCTAGAGIQKLDETYLHIVDSRLAEVLHDNWREQYISTHRTGEGPDDFEPRWKPVGKDHAWLERSKHDPAFERTLRFNDETRAYEVDIARVPFGSLPNNPWVVENRIAAVQAVALVHYAVATGTSINKRFLEGGAAQIHNMWVYRHPDVNEEAELPEEETVRAIQRLGYQDSDFTEVERNKDREHIVLAAELYALTAKEMMPHDKRKMELAHISKIARQALNIGSRLLKHVLNRPEATSPTDNEPQLTPAELKEHADCLIRLATDISAGWKETSILLTDKGDMLRTYMLNTGSRLADTQSKVPQSIYTAQLRLTGDKFQTVGGVTFTHFSVPYDTYFNAEFTSSRDEGMRPTIYTNTEHYHSVSSSPIGEMNTWAATEQAYRLIQWAQRDTNELANLS